MLGNLKLFSYWRSSASYRVRIALNLKGLEYELEPVHLARNGGEQHAESYRELNPQGMVPVLSDGGRIFRQSMAIIEYLEEAYPDMPLLPAEIRARGRVRSLCQIVACDIHPLNNLRVLQYLESELGINGGEKDAWYRRWVVDGFDAFESMLSSSPTTGDFCEGDDPGMADCFLIPQVYNAMRFYVPLDDYPEIQRIYENCMDMDEFIEASPERQPDAE